MSLRLRNICKYGTGWATLGPLLLPLPLHNANSPSSGAIHFRFRLPYDIYGAHRTSPGSSPDHLLALYSLFNQWLSAFHRGLETCPRKWQIAPLILPGCWCCCCCSCSESVPRQCLLCPLIHSVPFFRLALFFLFACLAGFLFLCSLAGTARNFLHMFTAWIFYGLKCFQLESFASLPLLLLCASCTLQKYKDAHKFIRLVSCSSTDIVGCESKAKGKCCSNSCPA